jgi:hypothetical protein
VTTVKLSDLAVTAEELNLLIYEAFILPEGCEELFCENEPGCVKGLEATTYDSWTHLPGMRDCGQQLKKCDRQFKKLRGGAESLPAGYGRSECYRYVSEKAFWTQSTDLLCGPLWATMGHYGPPRATMGHYWRCAAVKQPWLGDILEAQEYDFELQRVPGKQLVADDLMSRAGARDREVDPILVELESSKYFPKAALKIERAGGTGTQSKASQDLAPVTLDRDVWIQEQANDPRLIRVAANKLNQERCFELVDGLWHHKQVYHKRGSVAAAKLRVVVPASLRPTLMAIVHGLLGHRGVKPIVRRREAYDHAVVLRRHRLHIGGAA